MTKVWYSKTEDAYTRDDAEAASMSDAEILLRNGQCNQLSRFLTWALRHEPREAGLNIDSHGWVDAYDLTTAAQDQYEWVTPRHVAAVVSTDEKGRFEVAGDRIRATYAHSDDLDVTITDVSISDDSIPNVLYHGTATENVPDIKNSGLEPMSRKRVHLTDSQYVAVNTGERHSDDVTVFTISVPCVESHAETIEQRGDVVYVASRVPPDCLEITDGVVKNK